MKITPIDVGNLDSANQLLACGFPHEKEGFWDQGLTRIIDHHRKYNFGPIGYLLNVRGQDVGILLTIKSRPHCSRGTTYNRVNLSSWYVDESSRWLAAYMLKKLTSDQDVTYTDISPSIASRELNEKLGFSLITNGLALLPVPLMALFTSRAKVIPFVPNQLNKLSESDQILMDDHQKLGALSIIIKIDEIDVPIILIPSRVRGVSGVRVIYAANPDKLTMNIGVLARFLIRKGYWFIEMEIDHCKLASWSMKTQWRGVSYVKTSKDTNGIDHTYSELTFL